MRCTSAHLAITVMEPHKCNKSIQFHRTTCTWLHFCFGEKQNLQILVIEDDCALGLFLQKGLKLAGHNVQLAVDGQSGLQLGTNGAYDLIVLDLGLPYKDGVEVLQMLRSKTSDTSILVLTARNTVEDKIRCLDLGADDFLAKPFSFAELTARCRALLRRRKQFADPMLREGELRVNRLDHKVSLQGRPIDLTVKEFALLEYLMLARGRTCSRSELLREVWQMSPDAGTNVVDVYVNYLRKKLAPVPRMDAAVSAGGTSAGFIATVRGQGYSLVSSVPMSVLKSVPMSMQVPASASASALASSGVRKPVVQATSRDLYPEQASA